MYTDAVWLIHYFTACALTRGGSPRSAGRATAIAWAACACAVAATGLLAAVPVGVSETMSEGGAVVRSRQTLIAIEGHGVLPVLVAPVAITALAALTRRPVLRIALAATLDAACFLALLSIGAFYIPAAIALTIAAARTPRPQSERRIVDQISGSPGMPSGRPAAGAATAGGRRRRGRQ